MVYRFIDNNKDYFGLRWLCRRFGICTNGYYNYLQDKKCKYHEQRDAIYERMKYIFDIVNIPLHFFLKDV